MRDGEVITIKYDASVDFLKDDDNDGKRPKTLEVTLYEMSSDARKEVETITLKKTKDWTATIRDPPKYRDGAKINYSWGEEEIAGYIRQSHPGCELYEVDGGQAVYRYLLIVE